MVQRLLEVALISGCAGWTGSLEGSGRSTVEHEVKHCTVQWRLITVPLFARAYIGFLRIHCCSESLHCCKTRLDRFSRVNVQKRGRGLAFFGPVTLIGSPDKGFHLPLEGVRAQTGVTCV